MENWVVGINWYLILMISLLIFLVVVGVCLYLVETYLPLSPPIKLAIRVIVVIFVIVYLLRLFGVADPGVPTVR